MQSLIIKIIAVKEYYINQYKYYAQMDSKALIKARQPLKKRKAKL